MKKVLATILATAMAVGTSAVAFAADTNTNTVPNQSLELMAKSQNGDFFFDMTNIKPGTEGSMNETIFTFDDDKVEVNLVVETGEKVRADVEDGKVITNIKKVATKLTANKVDITLGHSTSDKDDTLALYDVYKLVVKSNAGPRDHDIEDWTVELDYKNGVYFVSGKYGYSDIRDVESDARYVVRETKKSSQEDTTGSIFNFDEVIDEETRISPNQYIDLFFEGNYGTDLENLRVVTDEIEEIADFFEDTDIDYYDFVGTPKFAHPVTVLIEGDSEAFLYEYDKKTGDITPITDYNYDSNGFKFKAKNLNTYIMTEVEYEGGNLNGDVNAPIVEKPTTSNPDKTNPGTGASDMTGAAVAMAVLSLVAAGAATVKKLGK